MVHTGDDNLDQFEYDDLAGRMVDDLPPWFNKSRSKSNYEILKGPGNELEEVDAEIENIEKALFVQTATTIDELDMLGDMVGISPGETESIEHFRARLMAEYQVTSAQGDINSLINGVANFLFIKNTSISYSEDSTSGGTATLSVPGNATSSSNLSSSEVAKYAEKMLAPSYYLTVIESGTLEYVTPSTYNDCEGTADSWSNYPGYDGTDTNGDAKGNGGTYSGVIE